MKRADAFANEVKSVHLYAFDKEGTLVWQQADSGEALAADGYAMTLGLPAGDYTLVAWCGLDNGGAGESFTVPEARIGETRIGELQCRLNRQYAAAGAYCKEKLHPLFHGMLRVTLPDNDDGGDYTYTMDLTKDTNHIRVILQHLSGKPVDENDFTFRIVDSNGLMDYDNSLMPDEQVRYIAYDVRPGSASLELDDYPEYGGRAATAPSSRAITAVNVAIADLTMARLVPGHNAILVVDKKDGGNVANIPLTDYALMLKPDGMDDSDYLDFQDDYALTFFLDESRTWIGTSIIINSWKVVLKDINFGK